MRYKIIEERQLKEKNGQREGRKFNGENREIANVDFLVLRISMKAKLNGFFRRNNKSSLTSSTEP